MPPLRTRHWSALVACVAATLRLSALDLAPFKLDEANALAQVRALVENGVLPATGGTTSWGLPDPPLVLYLLAIPGLVSREPALAAAWLGLLDTAGAALTCALAARWFGPRVGVLSGLLYATSPWAVYYARDVWVHVIPLFTVGALFGALEAGSERRIRGSPGAVGLVVGLGLQLQTHLLALLFTPAAALTLLVARGRRPGRAALLALMAAAALTVPYASYAWASRDSYPATVAANVAPDLRGVLDAAALAVRAVSGVGLESLTEPGAPGQALFAGLGLVNVVLGAALAGGLLRCLWLAVAGGPLARPALVLALWTVLPVALMGLSGGRLQPHYVSLLYPAGFLLAALGLAALRPRAAGVALGVAVSGLQVAALVWLGVLVSDADLGGGNGLPSGVWTRIASAAQQLTSLADVDEVYVATRGAEPDQADYPAAISYTLGGVRPIRFVDGPSLELPQGKPSLYVDVLGDPTAQGELRRLGRDVGSVALPGRGRAATFFLLPPRTDADLALLPGQPAGEDLARGVRFLGSDTLPASARAGESLVVRTFWLLRDVGEAEQRDDLAFFHHVVDARGALVAQGDGVAVLSRRWRRGSLLVQSAAIALPASLPAGPYRVLSGMYSRRDGQRATRLSGGGDTLELGVLQVGGG